MKARITQVPSRVLRRLICLTCLIVGCAGNDKALAASGFTDMGRVRSAWVSKDHILMYSPPQKPGMFQYPGALSLWRARKAGWGEIGSIPNVVPIRIVLDDIKDVAMYGQDAMVFRVTSGKVYVAQLRDIGGTLRAHERENADLAKLTFVDFAGYERMSGQSTSTRLLALMAVILSGAAILVLGRSLAKRRLRARKRGSEKGTPDNNERHQ